MNARWAIRIAAVALAGVASLGFGGLAAGQDRIDRPVKVLVGWLESTG